MHWCNCGMVCRPLRPLTRSSVVTHFGRRDIPNQLQIYQEGELDLICWTSFANLAAVGGQGLGSLYDAATLLL